MFQTINPANNQLLEQFPLLTDQDLALQLEALEKTYREYYRFQDLPQRMAAIQRFAADLEENLESYARLISLEMGKPLRQSLAEVEKCIRLCNYYLNTAPEILEDQQIGSTSIYYQPIGAVLGIMPWNFPFWQVCRFAVPALLAGNVVLLKPAANVPQCSLALEKALNKALGQKSIFVTLLIDEQQVAQVIKHPIVQGVALTGSDRAGSAVGSLAGKAIKKCVLELGGSDAFIVLKGADVAQAAEFAVKSRMNNGGQSCISAKRFIVVEAVADEFTEKVIAAMQNYQPGNQLTSEALMGPLARPDIVDNLERQVRESVALGAKILLDGGRLDGPGNCFRPMVLSEVTSNMPAYREELFGPVAVLFRVPDEAAAVALANDTVYGLGAAVWTKDKAAAQRVARALEVGALAVNNLLRSDPQIPFGGVKRSGFGKELGREGLLEFVNQKTIAFRPD